MADFRAGGAYGISVVSRNKVASRDSIREFCFRSDQLRTCLDNWETIPKPAIGSNRSHRGKRGGRRSSFSTFVKLREAIDSKMMPRCFDRIGLSSHSIGAPRSPSSATKILRLLQARHWTSPLPRLRANAKLAGSFWSLSRRSKGGTPQDLAGRVKTGVFAHCE